MTTHYYDSPIKDIVLRPQAVITILEATANRQTTLFCYHFTIHNTHSSIKTKLVEDTEHGAFLSYETTITPEDALHELGFYQLNLLLCDMMETFYVGYIGKWTDTVFGRLVYKTHFTTQYYKKANPTLSENGIADNDWANLPSE